MTRYLFGDEVDENIARFRSGEGTVWYLADKLGSVHDYASATGIVVASQRFDSFGQQVLVNGTATDRFAFTGREFQATTGNYFYRARFYNPSAGQFLSEDPISFASGTTNLRGYVSNNPINATDPTGTSSIIETALLNTNFLLYGVIGVGSATLGCTIGDSANIYGTGGNPDTDGNLGDTAENIIIGGVLAITAVVIQASPHLAGAGLPGGVGAASSVGFVAGVVVCSGI